MAMVAAMQLTDGGTAGSVVDDEGCGDVIGYGAVAMLGLAWRKLAGLQIGLQIWLQIWFAAELVSAAKGSRLVDISGAQLQEERQRRRAVRQAG